ncbi:MAG: hypothetical protein AB7P04_15995, partial [Bacteriovoracia bacterium]
MKYFARALIFGLFLNAGGLAVAAPEVGSPFRRAILFGGNCELAIGHPSNSFLPTMTRLAGHLRQRGWDVRPVFAGKSARCEKLATDPVCQKNPSDTQCCPDGVDPKDWNLAPLAEAAGVPPASVPPASAKQLLLALDAARELPAGSQLLIHIGTHGLNRDRIGNGKPGHSICVDPEDGDETTFEMYSVADGALISKLEALQTQGVRLAFIDDSCYSGGSIPVWSRLGCVMTSATADVENIAQIQVSSFTDPVTSQPTTYWRGTDPSLNISELLDKNPLGFDFTSAAPSLEEVWVQTLARSSLGYNMPQSSAHPDLLGSQSDFGTFLHEMMEAAYRVFVNHRTWNEAMGALPTLSARLGEYERYFAAFPETLGCADHLPESFERTRALLTKGSQGLHGTVEFSAQDWPEFVAEVRGAMKSYHDGLKSVETYRAREREIRAEVAALDIPFSYGKMESDPTATTAFRKAVAELIQDELAQWWDLGPASKPGSAAKPRWGRLLPAYVDPVPGRNNPSYMAANEAQTRELAETLARKMIESGYPGKITKDELAKQLFAAFEQAEGTLKKRISNQARDKFAVGADRLREQGFEISAAARKIGDAFRRRVIWVRVLGSLCDQARQRPEVAA